MKKILFVESWNCSPHLETSLELAKKHADEGDHVTYIFCGHDTPYKEGISLHANATKGLTFLPEVKGISLIKSQNISFYGRCKIPKPKISLPETFQSILELMTFKYKDFNVGYGVASSLISNTRNSDPDLKELEDQVKVMLQSSIGVYELTLNKIDIHKPDIVYVLNGRFCNHRPVMEAAQHRGIEVLFHERGATKDLYNVTKTIPHDQEQTVRDINSNWEKANEREAEIIAKNFYLNRFDCNSSKRSEYATLQQVNLLPEIDKTKRIITYFSSSDDEYASVGDIFKWTGWKSQIDAVQSLISICQDQKDIQLFIRLHPHLSVRSVEDQQRWLYLNQQKSKNVNIISFDSKVDTYALVDNSDIVITCGSTVGMEAVFKGKPTITLGPAYYSDLGATYKAIDHEDLYTLIKHTELKGDSNKALPFGYYMSTFGTSFKFYNAISMNSGLFLGINLQDKSSLWHKYKHYKSRFERLFKFSFKIKGN